ncbi:hypothetical protein MY04_4997 [Flammeovirga sp. MY04]|uniref:hypothetical protein n=1 Tax=Flammeovirga sp. MY04 TaxID=1191459 RepID=UPI000806291A|nr:hypothetical protein [Flammeovirga sp. MY04]ANQ52332.1 hypothetical protein MY04_4997 [Flammeovirga sp. MY04]
MIYRIIPSNKIQALFNQLDNYQKQFDEHSHSITFYDETETPIFHFRLPFNINQELNERTVSYVLCIIQTENASVGLVKNNQLVDHKTFATYAVRKKQGKSQIKYLKTRGKSKAGSRLRLANTLNFFEHINERLQQYFNTDHPEKIIFSCSKILIPYLFSSKVACPFDKKDQRIYKIPKYIPNANFEDLKKIHQDLLKGEFSFSEEQKEQAEEILRNVFDN